MTLLASACSSRKERPSGSTSGPDEAPETEESEAPTAPPPPPLKMLRGAWGTMEVDGAFRPGKSTIPLPPGMTADVEYVRYTEGGAAVGRLVIAHQDIPGLGNIPEPKLEHSTGDLLTAVSCPNGSTDTAEVVIANDERAHVRCTRSSLGPGIVATARKKTRAYEVICIDESDAKICMDYLATFAPASP